MITNEIDDKLPVRLPSQLGMKHLWILGSLWLFLILPGLLLLEGLCRFVLHVPLEGRGQDSRSLVVLISLCLSICVGGIAGKYLWILVMSRFVSKADIAPWLAYGIPRRVSRFDTRLLHSLDWKQSSGKIEVTEHRSQFTRREVILVWFNVLLGAILFTSGLPKAYAYPKQGWGDWLVFVIVLCSTVGSWVACLFAGRWAIRFLKSGEKLTK